VKKWIKKLKIGINMIVASVFTASAAIEYIAT
jgi:hypothetical protein